MNFTWPALKVIYTESGFNEKGESYELEGSSGEEQMK